MRAGFLGKLSANARTCFCIKQACSKQTRAQKNARCGNFPPGAGQLLLGFARGSAAQAALSAKRITEFGMAKVPQKKFCTKVRCFFFSLWQKKQIPPLLALQICFFVKLAGKQTCRATSAAFVRKFCAIRLADTCCKRQNCAGDCL